MQQGGTKTRALSNSKQSGFTLVELMVVTAIVGILASIAIPYMNKHILRGNLAEAAPYLLQIASKNRQYQIRTGNFYFNTSEVNIEATLGVDLKESGEFCYLIVCRNSTLGGTTTCTSDGTTQTESGGTSYISASASAATTYFEVWAIVRDTSNLSPIANSMTCTPGTNKFAPVGWGGSANRVKRAVVLRYPPPGDGIDANANRGAGATNAPKLDWSSGLSYSDAMAE